MKLSTAELREVGLMLTERLKIDYTNFNEGYFRRRLDHLFEKMRLRRVADLRAALGSLIRFDEMTYYLSHPGNEMFRSPAFWQRLIEILKAEPVERIWFPCLSSYHELFSLLIALRIAGRPDARVTVGVTSDLVSRRCLELKLSKRDDDYDRQNFDRLESGRAYDEFVTKEADGPRLRPELLKNVTFRNGWFMNFPDADNYDLIHFRNVLITYNRRLHERAMEALVPKLAPRRQYAPGAILCLGTMERPLGCEQAFDTAKAADGIFRLK